MTVNPHPHLGNRGFPVAVEGALPGCEHTQLWVDYCYLTEEALSLIQRVSEQVAQHPLSGSGSNTLLSDVVRSMTRLVLITKTVVDTWEFDRAVNPTHLHQLRVAVETTRDKLHLFTQHTQ